jgi:hypothetical protein
MGPPVAPSGGSAPDEAGWAKQGRGARGARADAARPDTTASTPAGHQYGAAPQAAPEQGGSTTTGLPTPVQHEPYDVPSTDKVAEITQQVAVLTTDMHDIKAHLKQMMQILTQGAPEAGPRTPPQSAQSPPWTAATVANAPRSAPPPPPPPPTPAGQQQEQPPPPADIVPEDTATATLYDLRPVYSRSGSRPPWPPVKPFSIAKIVKLALIPADMRAQARKIVYLASTHDLQLKYFLGLSDDEYMTMVHEGGMHAEWLQNTDATVAFAIHGAMDHESAYVRLFFNKFGKYSELAGSGRALLAHFKNMYNVDSGYELHYAEQALKAAAPFNMNMSLVSAANNACCEHREMP